MWIFKRLFILSRKLLSFHLIKKIRKKKKTKCIRLGLEKRMKRGLEIGMKLNNNNNNNNNKK